MSPLPRRFRSTSRLSLAVTCALLGAPLAAAPAALPVPRDTSAKAIEVLTVLRANADRSAAVARLIDLGPRATGALLSILAGSTPLDEQGTGPLVTPETEALFFEAALRWPVEPTTQAALDWLRRDAPGAELLLVLRWLGNVGEREVVPAFLEVLARVSPEEQLHPPVAEQVERALAAILLRDPRGHDVLSASLRDIDPLALPRLARAATQVGDGRGLALLDQLTGRSHALDLTILACLGDWPPPRVDCTRRPAAELATPYLTAGQEDARRQAAASMGRLRDTHAVPILIELLSDPDAGVRRTAHWALLRTVGGNLPPDPERWDAWLEAEFAWYETSRESLSTALGSDTGAAVQALRTVSAHPLFRSELVDPVARVLRHSDADVAAAACGTLAALQAPCAVAPLIEALGDSRPGVRQAAERALHGVSGETLPKDARAWRQWLED